MTKPREKMPSKEEMRAMEEAETVRQTIVPDAETVLADERTVASAVGPEGQGPMNEDIDLRQSEVTEAIERGRGDAKTVPESVEDMPGEKEAMVADASDNDISDDDMVELHESDTEDAIRAEAGGVDVSADVMNEVADIELAALLSRAAQLGIPELAGSTAEQIRKDESRAEELQQELDNAGFFSRWLGKGSQRAELQQLRSRLGAVERLKQAAKDAVPFEEGQSGRRKDARAEQRTRHDDAQKRAGTGGFGRQ